MPGTAPISLRCRRGDGAACSTSAGNSLAALLANIPWEIARPSADKPTLAERNLLLRIVHNAEAPAAQPLALTANGKRSSRPSVMTD